MMHMFANKLQKKKKNGSTKKSHYKNLVDTFNSFEQNILKKK